MVISSEGEGLANQVGVPLSQYISKKIFSVSFSPTQLLAVVLLQVLVRGILLLQDSFSSKGRYISQEEGWKREVKEATD